MNERNQSRYVASFGEFVGNSMDTEKRYRSFLVLENDRVVSFLEACIRYFDNLKKSMISIILRYD